MNSPATITNSSGIGTKTSVYLRDFILGDYGLQILLMFDLGDTRDLPNFPRMLYSLERRDPTHAIPFLEKRLAQLSSIPVMTLAVRGAAGATKKRWKQIRKQAKASPFDMTRCLFSPVSDAALGLVDAGDAFRKPVRSKVPTLFFSGTLDANTPPEQTELVREGFPNSGHVILEYGGHEDLMPHPAIQELILDFLGGAEPEDAWIEGQPPRFVGLRAG